MKYKPAAFSLQITLTVCVLLTNVVLIVVLTILLFNAFGNNRRAERIFAASQCSVQLSAAIREITFEHGRTNVFLAGNQPITEGDKDFIVTRRQSADEYIAGGLAQLERIDAGLAEELRSNYNAFLQLREKVDYVQSGGVAKNREQLRKEWFNQSIAFIYQVKNTIAQLGEMEYEGELFYRCHQFQLDSMEFRILIGQSGSIFAAAISKQTPLTTEEYHKTIALLAKADYLWSRMEADAVKLNNDKLSAEKARVYHSYYEVYRPVQEGLITPGFEGKVPPGAAERLMDLSVPAFDAVFNLVDAANEVTIAYAQTVKNKAAAALQGATLNFGLGLLFASLTILYFHIKLFRPLNHIVRTLKNISAGETVSALEDEAKRQDEIGRLAQGVEMLLTSLAEERRLKEQNEYLAITDGLTGCLNKRASYQRLEQEHAWTGREQRELSVAMLDVDNMKYINDTYGHLIGDEALKHLVQTIAQHSRPCDLIGRFGGDEFVLSIQGKTRQEIQKTIERIHASVQANPLIIDGLAEPIPLKISVGVAYSGGNKGRSADWFISQADAALYEAKQRGKNDIVFVQEDL